MRSGPSEDDDATAWASVAPSYNLWGVFKEIWIKDLSEGKKTGKRAQYVASSLYYFVH